MITLPRLPVALGRVPLVLLPVALILSQTAAAQTAPAAAPVENASASDTVLLSPFTVNTERDTGFTAVNAGTATRLSLDMQDVPAAYQVMTRDFIDALGINNIQEATQWTTNGGSIVDGNGQDVFNITFLANMRGVALSSGQQRNNYLSAGIQESYALERYEFSRGPNAALFSIGGNTALGGGMSATTKRSRYDRAFDTLQFTYGSWNYKRTTVDVNRPLSDKLAVRANAVLFDRGGWRMNEFEKTKGLTVAGSYLLTPKTEIRVEGAYDDTKRNNPQVNLFDNVSGWDGVTVLRGPITNAIWGNQSATPGVASASGYSLTWNGETQGVNRQANPYYVITGDQIMNYQFEGYTRRADETVRTPMLWNGTVYTRALMPGGTATLPFGNGGSTTTLPAVITPTSNGGELDLRYQQALPNDRYARALNGSHFTIPNKKFTNSPNSEIIGQVMKDANVAISHQVGDSLFLELGGDVNEVHDRRMNPNNLRNVRIDINQLLPNGQSNKHFLDPYIETPLIWNNRFTTNSTLRANAAWKRNFGKWGDYVLNLNGSLGRRDIKNRNYVFSLANNADPRMWQGGDQQIRYRYYFNDESRPYTDSGVPNSVYQVNWADGNAPVAATTTVKPRWVIGDWNDQQETFNNIGLAGSAKFFKGRLVFLSSTRFDKYRTQQSSRMEFGDLPTTWDGSTLYFKPDAPADWRSLSYIPRDNTTGNALATAPIPAATRPRINTVIPANTSNNGVQVPVSWFANDRFRNDYSNPVNKGSGVTYSDGLVYHALSWMSASANLASTYVPPPVGAFTLDNDVVEPRTGWGIDAGLQFRYERGLTAKVGYFYNVEEHVTIAAPTTSSINALLGRNAATDPTSGGRNGRGIPDVFGTDYQSARNRGFEFEVQGQITRGWRAMINIGTGKVENFDRFPLAKPFVQANAAVYKQVLEDAGGMLDTTQKPSSAPHAPGLAVANPAITPAIAAERTNAINDYNNIWINYEAVLNDVPIQGTNRVTANVFTDYTVQTGRLRGLRFGAGAQYRGTNFLQYRTADTIVDPNNPNLAVDDPALGLNSPVYVKMPTLVTATLGYSLRLKAGSYRWKPRQIDFQLRIKNLLNDQQVVYQDGGLQARPPGGDITKPNRVSVPVRIGQFTEPMSFLFTTTIKL